MSTRIGVDVGGTFTDVISYDEETRKIEIAKALTTPSTEEGVVSAVPTAVPERALRTAKYFIHATTTGLNALLQRKGAVVGLLATSGFRDVLEVRRGDREADMYSMFWKRPAPLVPRRLRLPVTERIRADGQVDTPLKEEDIRRAAKVFKEAGVACVAVTFLNAYANPAHELAAERVLREAGFQGDVSLSHQVSGEYREYERTSTTVIDASVRPVMAQYLRHLEGMLRESGFSGTLLITRSGGGAMTFAEAEARPFETILSGPVAGVGGAAEIARNLKLGDVISADVGGTSFDTGLITNGAPEILHEGRIVGLPVQTSWVDVPSIGAGGGSIAYVDVGGLLRVGPRSAGADPGPAAYGTGGTEPTATDAAVVLGMLADRELAGGIKLNHERARASLVPLEEALGLDTTNVARGVLTVLAATMADAMREITVGRGHDPRNLTLVAFGGAGPLFATLLASELGIAEIVIPPHAGNFSAWGLLGADLKREQARTRIMSLTPDSIDAANDVLDQLFAELASRASEDFDQPVHLRSVQLDMRYLRQHYSLTVDVDSECGRITTHPDTIHASFTREYERVYGHTMDEDVEIVSIRAGVRTPLPAREEQFDLSSAQEDPVSGSANAFSFMRQEWLPFQIVERGALAVGTVISGPALILEQTTTTYLDAGLVARVDPSSCLRLTYTKES